MMTAGTDIVYTDLFLLAFVPIIVQIVAATYILKIHHVIGRKLTGLFAGINGLMIWYDITVAYLIFFGTTAQEQPVQGWGLFIGFAMPTAMAALLFILQKKLKDALIPTTIGGLK